MNFWGSKMMSKQMEIHCKCCSYYISSVQTWRSKMMDQQFFEQTVNSASDQLHGICLPQLGKGKLELLIAISVG